MTTVLESLKSPNETQVELCLEEATAFKDQILRSTKKDGVLRGLTPTMIDGGFGNSAIFPFRSTVKDDESSIWVAEVGVNSYDGIDSPSSLYLSGNKLNENNDYSLIHNRLSYVVDLNNGTAMVDDLGIANPTQMLMIGFMLDVNSFPQRHEADMDEATILRIVLQDGLTALTQRRSLIRTERQRTWAQRVGALIGSR